MCANYTPTRIERAAAAAGIELPSPFGHYDIPSEAYPGYLAPIIRPEDGVANGVTTMVDRAEARLDLACFGLVPPWADLKLARSTYNARTETVSTKPAFRNAWKRRQFCVIPLENFYEPNYESGRPIRWRIEHAEGAPLAAAGMWEWRPNGGPEDRPLVSFTMLTINADDHPLMRRFHKPNEEKRTIVLLEPDQYDDWMHAQLEDRSSFLVPYAEEKLVATPAPKPPAKKIDLEAASSRQLDIDRDSLF